MFTERGSRSATVAEILCPKPDPRQVRLCGMSVVSQCLFYVHCRPVVQRLFPEQQFEHRELEKLADHIVQFSLAALRDAARARSPGRSY